MFISYLDMKKLASNPFGYVISRMRVFAGRQPLRKKDNEIKPPYVNIAGQHTRYKSFSLRNYVFSYCPILFC
ncbi:hypothetical protein AHAS_Ahas04G0145100 [Arachis hypogaea]